MKIIKGINRHQMQFKSLDEQVAVDNPVRFLDAFVDRLDMKSPARALKNLCQNNETQNRAAHPGTMTICC
jgi:hypothetical protein